MGVVDNYILEPHIKKLGLQEYQTVWQAMQDFTKNRDENTLDEFWIVEHPAVYTLGRNGKEEHILNATEIPIVKVDRGGQVTYHGPGQLIIYTLIDLKRRNLGIRRLVTLLENSIIELLADYQLKARNDPKAPGVYVDNKKVAALGLRVSRGCTTHGLSLNVDMDLSPFKDINPCGYEGLEVTQCKDLGIDSDLQNIASLLCTKLSKVINLDPTH
ncbi:MAG: lipoyl(octanoyl) transferase LipB [Cocleimonas sp.]